jgi:uncharacterized protein (TIGR02594 family)
MAGETLLEKLVIEIGLDPADFDAGLRAFLASYQNAQQSINKTTQQIEKDLDKGITRIVSGIQKQKREEEKEEEKARRKEEKEAERKQREQERAEKKEIDERERRIKDMFSSLKKEALGFLGMFLAGKGAEQFLSYLTNVDAATGRMSRTLDMSTRELSAWQGAAEQTGGSASSIGGALQGATADMNRFMLTGQGTLAGLLRPLNTSLFDARGNLKTAGELFLDLSDAVSKMDPARASAFLSMIPGMNPETINLLIQGRKAVEGYLDAARRAGGTTDESAAQAQRYQQSLANLERSATSLSRTLATALFPSLTRIMDFFERAFENPAAHWMAETFGKWFATSRGEQRREALAAQSGGSSSSAASPEMVDARARLAAGLNAGTGGTPPASVLDKARGVVLQGGPGAVEKFMADQGYPMSGNWCGEFVAAVIRASGGRPPSSPEVASNWRGWGAQDQMPQVGDIAVRRGGRTGDTGSHVTFVERVDPVSGTFTGLGGNQSRWESQFPISQYEFRHGVPTGAAASAAVSTVTNRGGDTNTRTNSVSIGEVNVHTSATDAQGIARDIRPALERSTFSNQANYGQQ